MKRIILLGAVITTGLFAEARHEIVVYANSEFSFPYLIIP